MNTSITIGFLHLGTFDHGVCLFGRRLAEEAKKRVGIAVIEKEIVLSDSSVKNKALLSEAAHFLSQADIVQIQFTEEIWGSNKTRLQNLKEFLGSCSACVVAVVHDTESIDSFSLIESFCFTATVSQFVKEMLRLIWLQFKFLLSRTGLLYFLFPSNAWIRRWLISKIDGGLVCTQEEKRRLNAIVRSDKYEVIPHYVEERLSLPERAESRKALGLEGYQVVTLLGFIFEGKGHRLALRALSELQDKNVLVVFAGGLPRDNEIFLKKLMELAQSLGVTSRLRITGYLEERELEKYLVATDLAVCPYNVCFASGALSTWLSVGCPVLVSDLPQFREYDRISPRSFMFFSPYSKTALARTIKEILSAPVDKERSAAIRKLREQLRIGIVFDKYLCFYMVLLQKC